MCLLDDEQWLDQCLGGDPHVRRPAAGRRIGWPGFRGPGPERRPGGAAGTGGRGAAGGRRTGAAGLGADRADRCAGQGSDRHRDAGQPAGPARAATRTDAGSSWPAGSGSPARSRSRATSKRASSARVSALPDQTRRLLLLAAADPSGDPALVWRAAGRLGYRRRSGGDPRPRAAWPSSAPGCGSAIRWSARRPTSQRRLRTGRKRTAPWRRSPIRRLDPDRRAWHRAQAAPGPDEDIAGELERSADRAQARGGLDRRGRVP